jgi:pentose-5-phosphate-3-epimerase
VHKCVAAGANVIVSGNGVLKHPGGSAEAMSTMKAVVQQHIKSAL